MICWAVSQLSLAQWNWEGMVVNFLDSLGMATEVASEEEAVNWM